MVSRADRSEFAEWWWTIDRYLLVSLVALMIGGVVLSFAGRMVPNPSATAVNISTMPATNSTGCGLYFWTMRYPAQNVTINEMMTPTIEPPL